MNSKIKQGRHMPDLRVSKLAYLIAGQFVLMGSFPFSALARDVFNPALLEVDAPHQGTTDLSVFEDGAGQPPGIYHVDIYLNNDLQDTRDVEFSLQKDASGNESLQPCLSVAELNEMGVKTELFPELGDKNTQ